MATFIHFIHKIINYHLLQSANLYKLYLNVRHETLFDPLTFQVPRRCVRCSIDVGYNTPYMMLITQLYRNSLKRRYMHVDITT